MVCSASGDERINEQASKLWAHETSQPILGMISGTDIGDDKWIMMRSETRQSWSHARDSKTQVTARDIFILPT